MYVSSGCIGCLAQVHRLCFLVHLTCLEQKSWHFDWHLSKDSFKKPMPINPLKSVQTINWLDASGFPQKRSHIGDVYKHSTQSPAIAVIFSLIAFKSSLSFPILSSGGENVFCCCLKSKTWKRTSLLIKFSKAAKSFIRSRIMIQDTLYSNSRPTTRFPSTNVTLGNSFGCTVAWTVVG